MPVNCGESLHASTVLSNTACTYISSLLGFWRLAMAALRFANDQLIVHALHGGSVTMVV